MIGLVVTAIVAGIGAAAAGAAVEAAHASAVATAPAMPVNRPTDLRVATGRCAHQRVELPNWRPRRMSIAQDLAYSRERSAEQRGGPGAVQAAVARSLRLHACARGRAQVGGLTAVRLGHEACQLVAADPVCAGQV